MGKVRILKGMTGHWQWVGLYREQGTVTSVSPGNPACSSPTLHTSYSRWLRQGDECKSGHWSKRLSLRVTLSTQHTLQPGPPAMLVLVLTSLPPKCHKESAAKAKP